MVLGTEALVVPYAAFAPDAGADGPGRPYRFGARLRATPVVGLGIGLEAAYPGSGIRLDLEFNR